MAFRLSSHTQQLVCHNSTQYSDRTDSFGTGNFGFCGSPASGDSNYNFGHLAMTYSALASLLVLGDDLSRVNRKNIRENMGQLQLEDGW